MNRSKKIISLLISMVLCALLPTFVWAVDSDGIEYSATIETPEITVSEEAQTVVITVKTDEIISYDGFEGRITLPSNNFVVESIETADKDAVSVLYNPANGKFLTDSDGAEIIESDTLLKITLTVPAGASEGAYATIIWFDELTSDYGEVFANNITVTATFSIIEEVTDIVVNSIGVSEYDAENDIGYYVEGNIVTVKYSSTCRVGVWNETSNAYEAITAVANEDDSYSYTVPEGVSEVLLVVVGDVTGDGKCLGNDCARLNAAILGKTTLTAEALFAGDVVNDGKWLGNDCARLNAVILGKTSISW